MRASSTGRETFASMVRRATRRTDLDGPSDEGIAMLTVIMLMMVMGALSVLLLGVVMAQVKPTMFAAKNARTVFAAETGLDSALSQVRSALGAPDVNGKIYGDPTKLPCTVQGKVNGSSSSLSYEVTMMYFGENPAGRDATWRVNNQLTCTSGSGVPVAPSFALLTAEGLDGGVRGLATTAGDRTLETVYTFKVTNNNINGGAIYALGLKHCLQASGQAVGSTVSYVDAAQCGADDPRQLWTYSTDYGIHLSVSDLGATPLCMTGTSSGASGYADVRLTPCTAGNTRQMFSWQGGAKWEGQRDDNTNYSGKCIGAEDDYSDADLTGKKLKYGPCWGNDLTYGSFDPDARVGPGAASKATGQIVNFLEFGRCMDVTGEKVNETFMISYPCKQDPSGGSKLNWNHKWSYTEPTNKLGSLANQQIKVTYKGTDTSKGVPNAVYCLKTPSSTANPAYVTFVTPCSGGDSEKWTRNAEMTTYAGSWTFTDRYGRCISLGDKYSTRWSKLVVAPCNGGAEQKWNAPELNQESKLSDYKELNN